MKKRPRGQRQVHDGELPSSSAARMDGCVGEGGVRDKAGGRCKLGQTVHAP